MSQKNEWEAFRAEVDERDYAWEACYRKAKKKRKRDYGRILAILVVVIFVFCWIMDDHYNVDILWNPQEGGVEYKLDVVRRGKEDDVTCMWAYWEDFDNTVRWLFLGDVLEEDQVSNWPEIEIAINGEWQDYGYSLYPQSVLFLDGWMFFVPRDEELKELSIRIKNDVFTVSLEEVPYTPSEWYWEHQKKD